MTLYSNCFEKIQLWSIEGTIPQIGIYHLFGRVRGNYKWPRWLDSNLDLTWGKSWDSSRNDYENTFYYTIRYMVGIKGLLNDLITVGLLN